MINTIVDYVKNIINEDIVAIECCSRLYTKNLVFQIVTNKNTYALKIFLNYNNGDFRFRNELFFLSFFHKTNIISVPKIYNVFECDYGKAIIMEWINGLSLKKSIKTFEFNALIHVRNMLPDLEKIHLIDIAKLKKEIIIDKIGLDNRLGLLEKDILQKIKDEKKDINFEEIFNIYFYLKKRINPSQEHMINSDVSMHEYLIGNENNYWIDFERFRIGDPNNDLARAFQSLTNGIYNNKSLFYIIFNIFKKQNFFDEKLFLYFLTEKLLSTIYTAPNQIEKQEICFYIDFIKENTIVLKRRLI